MAKKNNFLIGLGGSGGKVISKLYSRLTAEGDDYNNVTCIAIDTDQGDLLKLERLGVKTVCISGSNTVGQLINNLGDDVTEWCPNTANEGIFYSSPVFNGASQCRLKSRLCFASFLKNSNNSLAEALESALMVNPEGEMSSDDPPTIMIVSSIAGGTGSGIFIQTALFIKRFFKKYGMNVDIHGLFACPDLYKKAVTPQQLPSLYANAYAVIRELNAFNLICGDEKTTAYGGDLDIDIEISTSCEGKLFEKDAEGRYGEKPYDILYFIDRANYLKKIIGGLNDYYEAMANIAYSHLYSDLTKAVLSNESNELNAHSVAPCAVYGSAGASSIVYPYKDILRYFANRSISESISAVWSVIDNKWKNFCKGKDAAAQAAGQSKYIPTSKERAENYIEGFEEAVRPSGIALSKLSFLAPMVVSNDNSKAEILMKAITTRAESLVAGDKTLARYKTECGIGNTEMTKNSISNALKNASSGDGNEGMFSGINTIERNLETYCQKGLNYVYDMSIQFSNNIFCDDSNIWETFDDSEFGIINHLLYDSSTKTWVHPVAARYLMYAFREIVDRRISDIFSDIDTEDDDLNDFYNYLLNSNVKRQKSALSTSSKNVRSNESILKEMADRPFNKKSTLKKIISYFSSLGKNIESIDEVFSDALLYFSLIRVRARLNKLIEEYELFFDNIDEFSKKAQSATTASEGFHDESTDIVYVCASAKIKDKLYNDVGRNIDLQTGETASIISKAMFEEIRNRAFNSNSSGKKRTAKEANQNMENFFQKLSDLVVSSNESNTDIQGSLDMNVFQAMLYEYALTYPENADDEIYYSKDSKAKSNIDAFISKKLASLVKMSAPLLVYDSKDTYSKMFDKKDEDGKLRQKPAVSNPYRFISHNSEISKSIHNLVGDADASSAIMDFYSEKSTDLPKDTENQTVNFELIPSERIDSHTIICYSTVHCLQPYQIDAFDEIRGGVYYEYYARRISEMEQYQRYSMTPHLDKRWHKHGTMPYINVAKENERRYDLAKAFLYALCYGKIGYVMDKNDPYLVFRDTSLGRQAEIIFYKGKYIPYNKINRGMNWLADQDDLIERYSSLFDKEVESEIDKLSKYSDSIGQYKTGITTQARILNQMKRNIIRALDVVGSGNGRTKQKKSKDAINIIELAWKLHRSEENEIDKDYGELLINVVCQTIKRYARAPYNIRQIEKKAEGSESYINYKNVRDHIAKSFLKVFAESCGIKNCDLSFMDDDQNENIPVLPDSADYEETATGDLGDDETDLGDTITATKDAVGTNAFEWASAEITRGIKE